MKGNEKLHTRGKYTVYLIMCDECGKFGSDLNERDRAIEEALEKGFKNYKGNNLCPDCIANIKSK